MFTVDDNLKVVVHPEVESDYLKQYNIRKPKSWLKSGSSFSNGIGGTLFFGISDDRKPIGLSDVQKDSSF